MASAEALKKAAAERALTLVRDGMTVGIGTGTTAHYFIEGLGRLVQSGMRLRGVATSLGSAELARSEGLAIEEGDPQIDLAVDGADEIDDRLNMVKGRGGALFREKLVALAATRFVIIADESKLVPKLGVGLLPVEVGPFLWRQTARRLERLDAVWTLRGGLRQPYRTDNGNLVLDLAFAAGIAHAESLGAALKATPGVLEHGLFLGLATGCIVAGADGVRVVGTLE
ncbi:MAG: ribose-5-phosphate isomerase RpiA [Candidatus Dormibacteraeota bacterium]|nr:ribose-5-phosphate isomerase RpiA [Candidatus Dormibacteraeota bacterium]